MCTLLMKKAAGYVAIASLVACPFLSSVAVTLQTQPVLAGVSKAGADPVKKGETPALARNTASKPETTSTESSPKEQKVQDKKAIGRCWKRLMNMARELRHAHHKSN